MPKILPDKPLSKLDSYKLLKAYQKQISAVSIKEHFKKENDRLKYTWLDWENIIVDVSKNRIDKKNSDFNLEKCKFLESGTAVNGSFEIIFLCVKPQDIETAINENINIFRDDQTVISVAAGVTVGTIKKLLGNNSSVIRAMPNLCAVYNESITGICMEDEPSSERKGIVEEIFRGIGHVRKIDENEMNCFLLFD